MPRNTHRFTAILAAAALSPAALAQLDSQWASYVNKSGARIQNPDGTPASFTTNPLNTLVPGDTRYFMLWFRDPAGGPNGFNGSTALEATVCP